MIGFGSEGKKDNTKSDQRRKGNQDSGAACGESGGKEERWANGTRMRKRYSREQKTL